MEIFWSIMTAIAIVALGFLLIVWGSALWVIYKDIRRAKELYSTLPSRHYTLNHDQVYSHKWQEKDDGFVWFTSDGSFSLDHDYFLHNANYTYASLWGWYWLRKYQRWFTENIDIATLPKY